MKQLFFILIASVAVADIPPEASSPIAPIAKCIGTVVIEGRAQCVWVEGQPIQWDKIQGAYEWCETQLVAEKRSTARCYDWAVAGWYERYVQVKRRCGKKCKKL